MEAYLNCKFERYVAEANAALLMLEFVEWQTRAEQCIEADIKRYNELTIAQRVHERRNRENK